MKISVALVVLVSSFLPLISAPPKCPSSSTSEEPHMKKPKKMLTQETELEILRRLENGEIASAFGRIHCEQVKHTCYQEKCRQIWESY